jgi:hypothetical protein
MAIPAHREARQTNRDNKKRYKEMKRSSFREVKERKKIYYHDGSKTTI